MATELEQLKQTLDNLVDSSSDLSILLEFEEVLDNLHLYAYKNWEHGEVIAGPDVTRYWITVTLMYPEKLMPDPDGALRLIKKGAKVYYKKDKFIEAKKIVTQDDLGDVDPRTGKRKAQKKETNVWLVTIEMPRDFVDEFESSKVTINGQEIDLADVEGAYDDDYKSDINPDKNELTDELEK
jgi:hypothetical protein